MHCSAFPHLQLRRDNLAHFDHSTHGRDEANEVPVHVVQILVAEGELAVYRIQDYLLHRRQHCQVSGGETKQNFYKIFLFADKIKMARKLYENQLGCTGEGL